MFWHKIFSDNLWCFIRNIGFLMTARNIKTTLSFMPFILYLSIPNRSKLRWKRGKRNFYMKTFGGKRKYKLKHLVENRSFWQKHLVRNGKTIHLSCRLLWHGNRCYGIKTCAVERNYTRCMMNFELKTLPLYTLSIARMKTGVRKWNENRNKTR